MLGLIITSSNTKVQNRIHSKSCIYCHRTDLETDFFKEHIIPSSIGGILYIEEVCVDCNSQLGHEIDPEILKIPDILRAMGELSISHNRQGIIRSHYTVQGWSEGNRRNVRISEEGFEQLPTSQPDGSLITPDFRLKSDLKKIVERDPRIREAEMSADTINNEIKQLLKEYKDAKPGEYVESVSLGITLLRRQEKISIKITPKEEPNIKRFLAKIAYEFLYLMGGRELFLNPQVSEILFQAILGTDEKQIQVTSQSSSSNEYLNLHSINVLLFNDRTEVETIFFGKIGFRLLAPALSRKFKSKFVDQVGNSKAVGLNFQQNLKDKKRFQIIKNNNEYIPINRK